MVEDRSRRFDLRPLLLDPADQGRLRAENVHSLQRPMHTTRFHGRVTSHG